MVQLDVEVFVKNGVCRYKGELGETAMRPTHSALLSAVAASTCTMFRTLKMEAVCSSETSEHSTTTRCNNQKERQQRLCIAYWMCKFSVKFG